nr:TetR/AcrR family transcriptional regulator [Actinomyces sp. 186855]
MVLERGFAGVTVKELCERARINKKTFYRYYPAVEYLLAEVQAQYSQPYIDRIRGLSFPGDTAEITRAFFEFSVAQDEFYEAVTVRGAHDAIREPMIAEVEGATGGYAVPDGWDAAEWELYLAHVTSAPLHVYQAWVEGGKTMPAQRLVEVGVALVLGGARALEPEAVMRRPRGGG